MRLRQGRRGRHAVLVHVGQSLATPGTSGQTNRVAPSDAHVLRSKYEQVESNFVDMPPVWRGRVRPTAGTGGTGGTGGASRLPGRRDAACARYAAACRESAERQGDAARPDYTSALRPDYASKPARWRRRLRYGAQCRSQSAAAPQRARIWRSPGCGAGAAIVAISRSGAGWRAKVWPITQGRLQGPSGIVAALRPACVTRRRTGKGMRWRAVYRPPSCTVDAASACRKPSDCGLLTLPDNTSCAVTSLP